MDLSPKMSTREPRLDQADRETPTDGTPERQKTSEKESGKVTKEVDTPSKESATIEVDLSGPKPDRKLESTGKIQLENGAKGKETQSPFGSVITYGDSKEGARVANGGSKASGKENEAAQPAAKSGRTRHIIALLALSSIWMANMNRQAYNQALTRMSKRQTKPSDLALNVTSESVSLAEYSATSAGVDYDDVHEPISGETLVTDDSISAIAEADEEEEKFDWTSAQISNLQAGFSYGYTIFMIPGGRMSEIYGAKWVIFISSFGSALCSLSTPFLAKTSYKLLVASRVLMGLCQTGISPALYALYSRWLPPEEASLYLPMIKVGVMLGFTCGSLVNSFLNWQPVFYLLGMLGITWSAFWVFFASSMPSEHRFISQAEQDYIEHRLRMHSRQSSTKEKDKKEAAKEQRKSAPWLRILKNPIVLAFTFTKFTVKLSTETQSQQIPMYLTKVFQVSDELNGILNGANFAIQAIFTGIVAYVAKEMVVREQFGLRKTGIRRLFQAINCFGMSLAYLFISFNMGSLELVCCAVILLCVTSMFGAGGEAVLPIDLTTEYSASIMAIANSAANLSGIILPTVVGFFLADELTSTENWNRVWWFVSAVMACGGLAFSCIVKAKIQGFNEGKKVKRPRADGVNGAQSWSVVEMDPKMTMSHL